MLPWPTDRRHLAMMVRTFVDMLTDKIRSHHRDTPYPSDPDDEHADIELEEFLERLAQEAHDDEVSMEQMQIGPETEADVMQSLHDSLKELFDAAPWNRDDRSAN